MPGMFGIISRDTVQQEKFIEISEALSPYKYRVKKTPSCCIAAHAFQNEGIVESPQKMIAVDGDYSIYRSLSKSPESLYSSEGSHIIPSSRCTGNICIFDKSMETLYLAADLLNSFPLYYAAKNNVFIFSSRIKPLGKYLHSEKDDAGIFEFLMNGYHINNRTYLDGVFRVRAGELIVVNTRTLEFEVTSFSKLWENTTIDRSSEQLVETASRLLGNSFPLDASTMLMMSAGWDSRTILAAGLSSGNVENLTAYIHGDISSREVNIVDRICGDNSVSLIKQPICSDMFAAEVLQTCLGYTENVIFPHWHWAGEKAKEYGFEKIAAGIYGEALGGHYGPPWSLSGARKMISVFRYLLNFQNDISRNKNQIVPIDEASRLIRPSILSKPWYIDDDYWASCNIDVGKQINEDIDNVLSRYQKRGVESVEDFVEAFVSEHRGGQYIMAQLLSSRHHTDVCLPFAEPEFIELATLVPFGQKVHNLMNQAIIRGMSPNLLKYPMAATLVPAKAPMILQESSRILRKLLEEGRWAAHKASKGLINEPRMGWVNFQFLAKDNRLTDIVDLLKQPYWDRNKILSYIDNIEHTSLHPLSDMLMKILTVDHCVDT